MTVVVNVSIAGGGSSSSSSSSALSEVTLGAGPTAITHDAHSNRSVRSEQAGATSVVFAATATSGALASDSVTILNVGAGVMTASGQVTAAPNMKLTAIENEVLTFWYDADDDMYYGGALSIPASTSTLTVYSGGPVTLNLNASENVAVTQTIPAGLMGANGWFDYDIFVSRSAAAAGGQWIRAKIDGNTIDGSHTLGATQLSFHYKRTVWNTGSAAAQMAIVGSQSETTDAGSTTLNQTFAVNTALAKDFTITSQNVSVESGITLKIEKWILRVYTQA